MITDKAGMGVFGFEFVIGFAITSLIGGILSSKLASGRLRNWIVAYLGQMAIAAILSIFGYFIVNLITGIGGLTWSDPFDWKVGRWLAFVAVTVFYAKNVYDAFTGPELKPGFVAGRCGGNPKKWR